MNYIFIHLVSIFVHYRVKNITVAVINPLTGDYVVMKIVGKYARDTIQEDSWS